MSLLEKGSTINTKLEQSGGETVKLEDDVNTPVAECLRLQLIQEALDYVLKCREAAKKI